ncbi:MAG: tetratricopeptide repeat protein [Chthonomonadetes bacterium]|nr:tetratricopeptide repeat protein [Chthonomonadetes bacterium]
MKATEVFWVSGAVLLGLSLCMAQSPPAKPSSAPPPKQSAQNTKNKQPEWKALVQQAASAQQKGDLSKARSLLDKAYQAAPTGKDRAEVACKIAELHEKQQQFAEARRWYLEAIYAAPKEPIAKQAKEKMRKLPDPRRPAAAGATSTGGGTQKPR